MNQEITELAKELGFKLKTQGMKMATAESCTGGGIAQAITEIPGSSEWFDRGFVTYSNNAKVQMLQVKKSSINQYGAVSSEVATEMVKGAFNNSETDLAIAVTGIAGPDGGTEDKPVGTVYLAWMLSGEKVECSKQMFSGNRDQIRQQTVNYALKYCLDDNFFSF